MLLTSNSGTAVVNTSHFSVTDHLRFICDKTISKKGCQNICVLLAMRCGLCGLWCKSTWCIYRGIFTHYKFDGLLCLSFWQVDRCLCLSDVIVCFRLKWSQCRQKEKMGMFYGMNPCFLLALHVKLTVTRTCHFFWIHVHCFPPQNDLNQIPKMYPSYRYIYLLFQKFFKHKKHVSHHRSRNQRRAVQRLL